MVQRAEAGCLIKCVKFLKGFQNSCEKLQIEEHPNDTTNHTSEGFFEPIRIFKQFTPSFRDNGKL